jgi:hypothetical protein
MRWVLLVTVAVTVSGCAKGAIEHYDACMAEGGSFQAMAACGKAARMAGCRGSIPGCSESGNALMHYADALSAQVARRKMTDAEAMRRFVEFKTAQLRAVGQEQAQAAASLPAAAPDTASGPVTCTRAGHATACN